MNFKTLKYTLMLRTLGITKIPLILFVGPTVEEVTDKRCVVRIPYGYRTKNHLGSMYFGALAIGVDIAGGLMAVDHIRKANAKVSLAFKTFKAEFLIRPNRDTYFICEDGEKIALMVQRVLASPTNERFNEMLNLTAAIKNGDEYKTVAKFELELSLKKSEKGAI